ncbi:MAG: hypothetical protein ACJ74U_10200 [Jatrophihabitantaceae bacterium]
MRFEPRANRSRRQAGGIQPNGLVHFLLGERLSPHLDSDLVQQPQHAGLTQAVLSRQLGGRHPGLIIRDHFGRYGGVLSLLKFEARRPAPGLRLSPGNPTRQGLRQPIQTNPGQIVFRVAPHNLHRYRHYGDSPERSHRKVIVYGAPPNLNTLIDDVEALAYAPVPGEPAATVAP